MKPIKPEQLDFLNWELGVFFHFGIRTFYEGHRDWDLKPMDPAAYNPTELDCEQWIRMGAEGGAKYAILVCKHHDGFANWPSRYTDYSVAATPWRGGKGDLVKEFTDACRKYGLKVGLYYSPAEFGSNQCDAKDYDEYFINQVSELLGNYGKIDYLWFDGCGSENHQYDTKRIVAAIRKLQPQILLFNMWDPDTRWVGNESGIAEMPNPNVVRLLDFSVQTQARDYLEEDTFLPAECDFRIRQENWFYSDCDGHTLKSLDELMGLYYYSVGRGANMLVNFGPDRRGLVPEADAARFVEFGRRVKEIFGNPLACEVSREGDTHSLSFAEPTLIDHVVVQEEVEKGEHIRGFDVYIHPYSYGRPILVYRGMTVGHKHICKFPAVTTKRLDIVISDHDGAHHLLTPTAYYGG